MLGFLLKPFKKRFGRDRYYYRILDEMFGIYPHNVELYKLALIHRSASHHLADGTTINNERLEYLGDSVLQTAVSDYMFVEFPEQDEGFLTQMRSKVVSRAALNELSIEIGLARHIRSNSGGSAQKNLYGDALEAMIGAIYLDKGYNYANRLIINDILGRHLDLGNVVAMETDFKSRLIEWCQRSHHTIRFKTMHGDGSRSSHPVFRSAAIIDDMEIGYGLGGSKKEAEQRAACSVVQVLSDDMGDRLLDMVDEEQLRSQLSVSSSASPTSQVSARSKPRSRSRSRGQAKLQSDAPAQQSETADTFVQPAPDRTSDISVAVSAAATEPALASASESTPTALSKPKPRSHSRSHRQAKPKAEPQTKPQIAVSAQDTQVDLPANSPARSEPEPKPRTRPQAKTKTTTQATPNPDSGLPESAPASKSAPKQTRAKSKPRSDSSASASASDSATSTSTSESISISTPVPAKSHSRTRSQAKPKNKSAVKSPIEAAAEPKVKSPAKSTTKETGNPKTASLANSGVGSPKKSMTKPKAPTKPKTKSAGSSKTTSPIKPVSSDSDGR